MTDKEFVLSIYPTAKIIQATWINLYVVWNNSDLNLSGYCISEEAAWEEVAIAIKNKIAKKLESDV
jgi:hypothetical protein